MPRHILETSPKPSKVQGQIRKSAKKVYPQSSGQRYERCAWMHDKSCIKRLDAPGVLDHVQLSTILTCHAKSIEDHRLVASAIFNEILEMKKVRESEASCFHSIMLSFFLEKLQHPRIKHCTAMRTI